MTHALALQTAMPLGAGFPAYDFGTLLTALGKLVHAARRTRTRRALDPTTVHLLNLAAGRLAPQVLAATDAEDLDEIVDQLLTDPTLFHVNGLIAQRVLENPRAYKAQPGSGAVPDALLRLLGARAGRRFAAAIPMLDAWSHAQMRLLSTVDAEQVAAALELPPTFLLFSPEVPVPISRAVGDGIKAGIYILTLVHVAETATPPKAWLSGLLVDRLVAAVRSHLQLLAAYPEAGVPESALPAAERLDLAAIEARHRRARARAHEQLLAKRAELGLPLNPYAA